jgi:hypothetical protein
VIFDRIDRILEKDLQEKNEQKGSGFIAIKNVDLQNMNIDLSSSTLRAIEDLGFYYMIKMIRWKHYNKKKDTFEVTVFKDYMATLCLATLLFAANLDKLAIGLCLDQIISAIAYAKIRNDNVLMLPFFGLLYC